VERHVYKPPKGSPKFNMVAAVLAGAFMTFACFYVIPLMRKLDKAFKKDAPLPMEELAVEEPPEEFESAEEESPPEEEPEEPPQMEDSQNELDLALELPDLTTGVGGIMIELAPKFDVQDNPEDFFDSGDLDQPPRATSKFPPGYPPELLRKKITGRVVVRAMVDENGAVGEITIKESSGYPSMDRAAENAIKRWRYKPAIKSGREVRAPVVQPFNFKVQ
jgi:TonB family protein